MKWCVLCVVLVGALSLHAHSPESDLIALINQERTWRGIPPVRQVQILTGIALAHSLDMAVNDFLSHYGSDGRSPWERMTDAGYPWPPAGEIISAGNSAASSVIKSWMASEPHRAILLDRDLCEIGVGYVSNPQAAWNHYWTADLGCRPPCIEENACPFQTFLVVVGKSGP
jgi:uncharacterized protein YkwD